MTKKISLQKIYIFRISSLYTHFRHFSPISSVFLAKSPFEIIKNVLKTPKFKV